MHAIQCPPLETPNNTELFNGDPNQPYYKTTIEYRCAEGHDLMFGDLFRTCQNSKTWSGSEPTCIVVSCGPAAPVANAYVSVSEDVYATVITYVCKPGYKPLPGGNLTRQCQADKRWSGTAPQCEEIRCGAPPTVAKTTVTTDGVRVNDTATYSCLAGYRLRAGSLTKVCNEQEQWQNEDPQCEEVHCGPAIGIKHTKYSLHGDDKVDGKVTYTCNRGYQRLSGDGFSRCQLNGTWTKPTLICEEVTCGMPPPVKNADVTTTCVTRGCVADYRCYVGYEGQTQRSQCTVDGKWTRVSINCTRTRCDNIKLGVGVIVTHTTGDSYEDTMTVHCRRGYHRVTGSHLRTCVGEGAWSGTVLVCAETTCLTPAHKVNGADLIIDKLTVGSKVTYRTRRDRFRHVSGDLVRTCREDKLWTGELPVFEEIACPAILVDDSKKAKVLTNGVVVGSRATYSCERGHEITAGNATCECLVSGKWSCGPPTCTRVVCGYPPTVANTRMVATGQSYLDTVSYTCKTGYLREGPEHTFVCSDQKRWEGDGITCTAITCPTPELPHMATYKVTAVTYMSQVTYSCRPGYVMARGDEMRICEENGRWSGTAPTCEKVECSRPPDVVNTTWYEDKKSLRTRRVIYLCLPRYRLVSGQLWKVCGPRGNWTGRDPVCEATGEKVTIFVPKDEEPKTAAERAMKAMGFKKVDKKTPNIGIGIVGAVLMFIPVVIIVASDLKILKKHLKVMSRNVKEGFRRLRWRNRRVAPEPDETESPGKTKQDA
ncbi:hypothetical protein NP493_25g07031 [Ridgeia piscesae]|uniref:Sushi domain-containing protein n=1 Tax=Ridgeia piscesae TaxID=27915 RepID=A0AAD9UKK5_RIDPI|nr:hypothetical protein NP493_25g07031 [Ridgeia piscesae]